MKKVLSVLILVLVLTLATTLLVACDDTDCKKGHDYQEVEGTASPATCTEAGKKADQKCSRCGELEEGEVVPAIGHDYTNATWQVITPAECEVAGSQKRSCDRCGEAGAVTEVIPATGHVHTHADGAVEPGCLTEGRTGTIICDDCHKIVSADAVVAPRGHDYQPVADTAVAPTCTTGGREPDTKCSRCADEQNGAELDALGHAGELRGAVPATEEAEGYSGDTYCSRCEELLETGHVLPRLGLLTEAQVIALIDSAINAPIDVSRSRTSFYQFPEGYESEQFDYDAETGDIVSVHTVTSHYNPVPSVYETYYFRRPNGNYELAYVEYAEVRPTSVQLRSDYSGYFEDLTYSGVEPGVYDLLDYSDATTYAFDAIPAPVSIVGQVKSDGNTYVTVTGYYADGYDNFEGLNYYNARTTLCYYTLSMVFDAQGRVISSEERTTTDGKPTFTATTTIEYGQYKPTAQPIEFIPVAQATAGTYNPVYYTENVRHNGGEVMGDMYSFLPGSTDRTAFQNEILALMTGIESGQTFTLTYPQSDFDAYFSGMPVTVTLGIFAGYDAICSVALGESFVVPYVGDAIIRVVFDYYIDLSKLDAYTLSIVYNGDTIPYYNRNLGTVDLGDMNGIDYDDVYGYEYAGFSATPDGDPLPYTTVPQPGDTVYIVNVRLPAITIVGLDDYQVNIPISSSFTYQNGGMYFTLLYKETGYVFDGYYLDASFETPVDKQVFSISGTNYDCYLIDDVTTSHTWYAKMNREYQLSIAVPECDYVVNYGLVEDFGLACVSVGFSTAYDQWLNSATTGLMDYYGSGPINVEGFYLDADFSIPFTSVSQLPEDDDLTLYLKLDDVLVFIKTISLDIPLVWSRSNLQSVGGAYVSINELVALEAIAAEHCSLPSMMLQGFYLDKEHTVRCTQFPTQNTALYPKLIPTFSITFDGSTCDSFSASPVSIKDIYSVMQGSSLKCKYDFDIFYNLLYGFWSAPAGKEIDGIYKDAAFQEPLTEFPMQDTTLYVALRDCLYVTVDAGEFATCTFTACPVTEWHSYAVEDASEVLAYLVNNSLLVLKPAYTESMEFEGLYLDAAFTIPYTTWPTAETTIYVNVVEKASE